MKALILSADSWSMVDEKTGEELRGTTIFYVNNYRSESAQSIGLKPTKISASYEILDTIKLSGIALPAWADISLATASGAQGKAKMIIESIDLTEAAELF